GGVAGGGRGTAPGAPPTISQFETVRGTVEAAVVPSHPPGTVVVVARDVTAARRVERLRRDFVANASHELKTPVASILAIAETLRQAAGDDPEHVTRFPSPLEQEAARLAPLVPPPPGPSPPAAPTPPPPTTPPRPPPH